MLQEELPGNPNSQKEMDVSPVLAISYVKDPKQTTLEQPVASVWDWVPRVVLWCVSRVTRVTRICVASSNSES